VIHRFCSAPEHEEGDCYRTCIAMILNVDSSFVPNFAETHKGGDTLQDAAEEWLSQFGLGLGHCVYGPSMPLSDLPKAISDIGPNVPAIVSGLTERGNGHSAVVWQGRWYDPAHGNELGETSIVGPFENDGYWVGYISASQNFKLPVKHDGY